MGDDVFHVHELFNAYWVASSTKLEENLNFYVAKNIFVDVDVNVEELNDILRINGHIEVNWDDDIDEL
jgi:predicted metal-dependent hydrolase